MVDLTDILQMGDQLLKRKITSLDHNGRFSGRARRCPYCFSLTKEDICRKSERFSGCQRPFPSGIPWEQYPETHVAIFGPRDWKVLSVLGLMQQSLMSGNSGWTGEACWDLTQREHTYLTNTFAASPQDLRSGMPGYRYTIGRSAIFKAKRKLTRRLLSFHNIAPKWLVSDTKVHRHCYHLAFDNSLIFVMDDQYKHLSRDGLDVHCSIYARILRYLESLNHGIWRDHFDGRVAVVLPRTSKTTERFPDAEAAICHSDPQLWGLLQHTVSGPLELFCGPLRGDAEAMSWVPSLLHFVMDRPMRRKPDFEKGM